MKKKDYLLSAIVIAVICFMSCKSRLSNNNFDTEKIETIKGEDIELRNKLRSKRERERNRHKNRNIVNEISRYYHINKFQQLDGKL